MISKSNKNVLTEHDEVCEFPGFDHAATGGALSERAILERYVQLFNEGVTARQHGSYELARQVFEKLLVSAGSHAELYHELGIVFQKQGIMQQAAGCYLKAIALNPYLAESYYNLGLVRIDLVEYESAIGCFRRVCELLPGYLEAHHNLCVCLQESGLLEDADNEYRRVMELFPDFAEAKFNRACLALLRGDFSKGLPGYEERFSKNEPVPVRKFPQPRWDGVLQAGKTILIHTEQGFGDAIQVVRYASLLSQRGFDVVVESQPELRRLLSGVAGISMVVARGESLPEFDVHLPMMSLPLMFGTTPETIPATVPYIFPEKELTACWRGILPPDGALKVGLVWSGRKDHQINRKRSCPLHLFAPLSRIAGVRLYSLQFGSGASDEDLMPLEFGIHSLPGELRDFADTAACTANLDLVISIDTAVAHLAGALGRPVWVLLPFVPDWRWQLQREDSPWYPTMRLFRQSERGNWSDVIDRVVQELEKVLHVKSSEMHNPSSGENMIGWSTACLDSKHIFQNISDSLLGEGTFYHEQERYADALDVYDRLLALNPGMGPAHHNRGNTLLEMGRYRDAIASYREAIRLIPGFAEGYVTIATALQSMHKPYEAMASCHRALAIDQDNAEAHWNLALALLQIGEFEQGWEEFEWRWKKRGFTSRERQFEQPLWDGSCLKGKRILIHAEQGFGDTFQFARYLPLIAEQGGEVLVECPAAMKDLLAGVPGVSSVVAAGDPLPEFDCHLPIMSLPLAFCTRLDSIPLNIPYIYPPLASVASWTKKFVEMDSLRIGLVWAGRKRPDPNRTCDFENFAPLSEIPGVTFYSLQLENEMSARGTKGNGPELVDYTADIKDFCDTAALIAHLDLVISVDTGVAHLAGVMGKETWVMLPYSADWRWMLERDDSPWYPGMRLFRQEHPGGWQEVVERLRKCILEKIANISADRNKAAQVVERNYTDGLAHFRAKNIPAAEHSFLNVLIHDPRVPEVFNALGVVLREKESSEDAFIFFKHAVSIDPGYVDAAINYGNALYGADLLEESVAEYGRGLRLAPDDARLYQNLGVALQALGKIDDAETAFSAALRHNPEYGTARWNLAVLKLLTGDYREGFEKFESRFEKNNPVPILHGEQPLWNGENIAGKRLLVHAEQGFGDTFQFVRYLPLIVQSGVKVVFECQDRTLCGVLKESLRSVDIYVRGEVLPSFDFQVPLLSLPRIFGTTEETIPNMIPYLHASSAKQSVWAQRLAGDTGVRIGLVWAGRTKPDPKRSTSLAAMAPLADIPEVTFYSLQFGRGSEQALEPPGGMRLVDLSGELNGFSEPAALIANLDLVITIDSAVAHLAGAMGKETWVLLPYAADWRWMQHRTDSPWYPTMRLFRQDKPGDWSRVMCAVREQLRVDFSRFRNSRSDS